MTTGGQSKRFSTARLDASASVKPSERTALLVASLLVVSTALPAAAARDEFTAGFETDVVVADGPSNATLHVTGRTGPVTVRSDDVDDPTLVEMFGARRTDGQVVVDVPPDGTLTVAFPDALSCSPGRYEFTFVGGNATATAAIDVTRLAEAPVSFDADGARPTVRAGRTATVGVRIDVCFENSTTLSIGGEESSIAANATVVPNGSGDRRGAIRVDTGSLTGPGAFETTGELALRNVTVARVPTNGRLQPGEYALELSADGEVMDVGRLTVRGDATVTTAATPTVTEGEASTRSPTATPTPIPTPAPTNGEGETDTSRPSSAVPASESTAGTTTAADGPGFGPTAVLLALAVLWLCGHRRPE